MVSVCASPPGLKSPFESVTCGFIKDQTRAVEHCLFLGNLSTVLVLFSTDIEKCISQVINDKYPAYGVITNGVPL